MKKHKCAFAGCKYKHLSMLCILDHMFKDHGLRINGKRIYLREFSCDRFDAQCTKDEEVKG